ncbi:efflux RND transporter periplasmic adaptor subunit [uncultured Aureimonas sp.]|uniref:efflux RND transporter periplasmic adaptor subunit n=1 Tax=uncultured Aureimonas sp. TaxID=1604662 RepID=UPI0025F0400E|nr:efflux RND transporter periplasmic adaptor subunit [uncultured Aureimonas sp.]
MPRSSLLLSAVAILTLAAPALAQAPGGGAAPPPPAVTVMTIKPEDVPVTFEYPARVSASREVEVRAQVGGILLRRTFNEGSRVKEGDLLFEIDRRPFEAQVALAEAQLQQAQATQANAQRTQERTQSLVRSGATSTATLDDATAQRLLADAQVAAAEAQLQTATLNLDYASVEAPASGITSLEQVPEGSLLTSGALLTRITQLDPAYVNFSAADSEAFSIRNMIETGKAEGSLDTLRVTVRFGNGTNYPQQGTIDFTSSSIDESTGTILSRAVLPNPESQLLPGQFVRVEIEGIVVPDAVTIPTEALMQGPQGTFVYTLDDKNVAAVRPVTVGRELEGRLLIADGLKDGDKVVTVGVIKVRPGSPVNPTGAQPDASGGQPAAGANAAPAAAAAPQQAAANGGAQGTAQAGAAQ